MIYILKQIKNLLKRLQLPFKTGFYNGHYSKDSNGEFVFEYFPIPVISVLNTCDIEIGVNEVITITAKLKRENAITFKYDLLCNYDFEVYGVFDYLTDFYLNNGKLNEISLNIEKSQEIEVFISIKINATEDVLEILSLLQSYNFYY